MPVSVVTCVPPLKVTVTDADFATALVGSKVTWTVHVADTARLDGQLFVCVKLTVFAPVMAMLEIATAEVVLFCTVIGFAALFIPTV